ncbi:CHH-like protein isoform X2 [Pararge aegeria]|uniref:CHH-like protein isoform X2 n=1 Tax=Pararge aegeria TaxID=116150 RepID=UPI0019CF5E33|nr:CHH-like protein isoform X2 [Pararge aegeria]
MKSKFFLAPSTEAPVFCGLFYLNNILCLSASARAMHLSSIQVCALMTLALATAPHAASAPHHVARRSFFNLQCKGVYDAAIFARLDRICDDCYNLFREPKLYNLCRSKCFTSPYFKGCMESLYLYDEEEQLDQMIDFIGKR